jgi:hypothetical protein
MKSKKMNFYTTVVFVIAVLGFAPQCYAETPSDKTSLKEIEQESQDLIQTLKAYSADQRDEAIEKTKAALDNLDKRIDTLEERIDLNWDKMNEAARNKARASLKLLHQQRVQVAEWYGSLKNSSDDVWKHMKKGFSNAYSAINDAWEKAEKEFESGK